MRTMHKYTCCFMTSIETAAAALPVLFILTADFNWSSTEHDECVWFNAALHRLETKVVHESTYSKMLFFCYTPVVVCTNSVFNPIACLHVLSDYTIQLNFYWIGRLWDVYLKPNWTYKRIKTRIQRFMYSKCTYCYLTKYFSNISDCRNKPRMLNSSSSLWGTTCLRWPIGSLASIRHTTPPRMWPSTPKLLCWEMWRLQPRDHEFKSV